MTPNDIVIISAGKFGREISSFVGHAIAAGENWRLKGFLDSRPHLLGGFNRHAPILSAVEDYQPAENDLFLCAIGEPAQRRHYTHLTKSRGARFATLIHPTAMLGDNVTLGEGVMIAPYAVLTSDTVFGDSVYLGPHGCCSHDNRIGDWSHISGHCALGGCVTVDEAAFFGIGAIVVPGVRIGANAFIGAGSVVLKNVRAGVKVFGNPALPID
jgi:sugar O-acyltransferase (sialic acid O-acetyltransferase NeuD family)